MGGRERAQRVAERPGWLQSLGASLLVVGILCFFFAMAVMVVGPASMTTLGTWLAAGIACLAAGGWMIQSAWEHGESRYAALR